MTSTTTTSKGRRDVHRPAELRTEDYEYLYAIDNQSPWALGLSRDFLAELTNYTDELGERGSDQCHHCGAHIRYAAFLRYVPTGRTIVVGETCLDNRFSLATREFHKLRKAAQLDRERHRIQTAISEFCEANPDLGFMANDPNHNSWPIDARDNSFVIDVAAKLRRYGSLSERQMNAIRKVIKRDRERRLERAAEEWIPVPSRDERVRVEGVVLSTRWDPGYGGDMVQKMLLRVETDGGNYKIWGNTPSRLDVQRGDRIRFTVRINRSDRDDYFGFFKMDSGSKPELVNEEKS